MIYLDNSATTKPSKGAMRAATEMMTECFGNPSARYYLGISAEKRIKEAREQASRLFSCKSECITFTSGGTEADNIAILGGANPKVGRHLITTQIEHPAVLRCFEHLEKNGFEVTYLKPDGDGCISLDAFQEAVRPDTVLASVMHVNNETGAVQPIEKMKAILQRTAKRALFHVDAVQSFGKMPLFPEKWGVDLMSASAHKIHGLKGCGALYIRKGLHLLPVIFGGGQEKNVRSGTENTVAIAAFGAACAEADFGEAEKIQKLKERLFEGILSLGDIERNGKDDASPYILNVSFLGIRSEILLNALSNEKICVSAGSACSSSKSGGSHVLLAMERGGADNAIRFSFSKGNTMEEIEEVICVLHRLVPQLRK